MFAKWHATNMQGRSRRYANVPRLGRLLVSVHSAARGDKKIGFCQHMPGVKLRFQIRVGIFWQLNPESVHHPRLLLSCFL